MCICLGLKELLVSKGRQRILEILLQYWEMNVMQMVHKTGGKYCEVNRNLKILEAECIVISECRKQVKRARARVIKLNKIFE